VTDRADRLFEAAQALAPEERAILALQLLDSVGEPTKEIERVWLEEVRVRLAAVASGQASVADWEEARHRIFARG
jgi:putative addiction module component (TIGR02574 family)